MTKRGVECVVAAALAEGFFGRYTPLLNGVNMTHVARLTDPEDLIGIVVPAGEESAVASALAELLGRWESLRTKWHPDDED